MGCVWTAGRRSGLDHRPFRRMWLREQGLSGVFIGSHAVSEGALTRKQLRKGPYIRVLQGVYADPTIPRDHLLRCRAAALLMPDGAALGGWSAATVLGAPEPGFLAPVTVVLPDGLQWRGPAGVRVHRRCVQDAETRSSLDGLRHTEPIRTAWDVAALETPQSAVGVLDAMVRAGLVGVPQLKALLRRRGGAWGARRVRRAFELVDGRAQSPPESWVRVACALAGLPAPVPQYDVVDGGEWLGCVDLAWPEHRVIVEYEGAYHFDGVQIAKDDVRIARLVAAGWRVIRVAAHDLRDMDAVVVRIAAALSWSAPGK